MEMEWSPEDDMLTFEEAKKNSRDILEKYPGLSVCGSLSLMLAGLIKERPLSDIDFECLKEDLPKGCKNNNSGEYTHRDNHSKLEGIDCNFFVAKTKPNSFEIEGIKVSSLKLTMQKKFKYWRRKDRDDLNWCRSKTSSFGVLSSISPLESSVVSVASDNTTTYTSVLNDFAIKPYDF